MADYIPGRDPFNMLETTKKLLSVALRITATYLALAVTTQHL